MQVRSQLAKVKKHDYPNGTTFLNNVKSLSDVLTSIGQPLRPEDFNNFLLAGLGNDYDALADRISTCPTYDPMSKREVYAQLLNTEQRVEGRRAELGVNIHHTNYTLRPSGGHGGAPSNSNASRVTRLPMLADAPPNVGRRAPF
jgi:hypothetical protein